MPVTVRPLADADLPAVEGLLLPSEARSTFLLGNARGSGITDRGGHLNGTWLGAFEGDRLAGVLAHARGPDSMLVAPFGHARPLLAEADRRGIRPSLVLGTGDRVDEAVAAFPPSWRIDKRMRETLFLLRWPRWTPPPPVGLRPSHPETTVGVLRPEDAAGAALVLDVLSREGGLHETPEQNLRRAERLSREGRACVARAGGRVVAISCEAASTGRLVHVGATATEPAFRRRGLAGACVAAVLERARDAGRATEGAVLFTGEENAPARALYERLGFVAEAPFELCVLEKAPRVGTTP